MSPEALPLEVALGGCAPGGATPGAWTFLSDLPWSSAQSGWQAVADKVLPERDAAASRNPLVVGGATYAKGLGMYPLSEVTYALEGRYSALQAQLGLNGDAPPDAAAVFLVYADGALVYNSGAVAGGAPPKPLDLCVAGVRHLRLVAAFAGQPAPSPGLDGLPAGEVRSYADWADARVFQPEAADLPTAATIQGVLDAAGGDRTQRVIGELGAYQASGQAAQAAIAQALHLAPDGAWPAQTQAVRDQSGGSSGGGPQLVLANRRLVLANRRLALALGVGGAASGRLTVVDPATGALIVAGASSAVATPAGLVDLARQTVPAGQDAFALTRIEDPLFGPAAEARATFRLKDVAGAPDAAAEVRVALFDDQPWFTYQVTLTGWPATGGTAPAPVRLDYLAGPDSALVLGDHAHFFADASYVREGEVADDGLWRSERLGIGKPAAVWGDARPGAIVFSELDEQRLPAWLVLRRDPARAGTLAGIAQPLGAAAGGKPVAGPRLLVQVTQTTDLRAALAGYRQVSAALYPPAPLPDWLRYQWGSWWVYGDAIDETKLRRQIDLIATYLGDLGAWHILIDAGWQDLGPSGSGELWQENRVKFPSGLRALVDYAHAKGIHVVLFFSAVYVHDGTGKGEWLGMPKLIAKHPDWFVPLTPPGTAPARFLLDYANPAARQYVADSLARYVTAYDADGVKIDGLGDVEGQLTPLDQRASILPERWALTPVVDVYRLVAQALRAARPDAFIESGWVNPAAAQPYAQAFRYGDESDTFDFDYPFPGLRQHFEYAAVQQGVLGQRANVGAIFGSLSRPIAEQWLGAALALGAEVSLGSDFGFVTPEGFAGLRPYLVNLRPFAGTTRTGPQGFGLQPSWAATTNGDLTFLALVNRASTAQRLEVPLAEAGLDPAAAEGGYVAYDVAARRFVRVRDTLAADVPAQTLQLYVLRRTPGVVWTSSSYTEQPGEGGWHVAVRGPADVPGWLALYAPGRAPQAVLLDGRPLGRLAPGSAGSPEGAEGFSYDASTGTLTLRYGHAGLEAARAIDVVQ